MIPCKRPKVTVDPRGGAIDGVDAKVGGIGCGECWEATIRDDALATARAAS